MKSANFNIMLDQGWKFLLGEAKRFRANSAYDVTKAGGNLGNLEIFQNENNWKNVEIPHDWLTELPLDPETDATNGYKKRKTGWYYVTFQLSDEDIENARLIFEGVLGKCEVYVNETIVVRNFSGYNRFDCEIGSYLVPGKENRIAVYVDASVCEGWWYEGAGLYRPVYIEFREAVHFDAQGCFVRSQEIDGEWNVIADLTVLSELDGIEEPERLMRTSDSGDEWKVITHLEDSNGTVIAECKLAARKNLKVQIPVEMPQLWSPETPVLYVFSCDLMRGEEKTETLRFYVGLRSITWDKDTGMYLNGKPYQVKGICCHQDHAGVGAAVTAEIVEYRIARLKALGINAYRCAHHAPSEMLLEICDRRGMLVMVENRHFSVSADVLSQLESLIRMSRNHPSVFIYSMFNEEYLWQTDIRGYRIMRQMRARVLALDDTRAVTGAINAGAVPNLYAADAMDVVGINYHLKQYEEIHNRMPDKPILGSENCPTYATRGVYKSDPKEQIFACYGSDECPAFAETLEETVENVETKDYNAGCFAWCGFDYYGEPSPHPWPSTMSHWGFMDNCGFAKDTAYELAACYRNDLCVHLFPHWNWHEGEEVRVCAFTNAETAELFVNGRSAGEIPVNRWRAEWKVPFESGSIFAKARRNGEEVTDEVWTAKEPAELVVEDVTPDGSGDSVRILNIRVADENGVLIPDFDKILQIQVNGVEIKGVGNGNPNGLLPNAASSIPLFHGMAQLIVTAKEGSVTVQCEGLPDAKIDFCNDTDHKKIY